MFLLPKQIILDHQLKFLLGLEYSFFINLREFQLSKNLFIDFKSLVLINLKKCQTILDFMDSWSITYFFVVSNLTQNVVRCDFCANNKPDCFGLIEFTLITKLKCSAYPRKSKLLSVYRVGERFYYRISRSKKVIATSLLNLIKSNRLKQKDKLKYCLVLFQHVILLVRNIFKVVDSNLIKIIYSLDFFEKYSWERSSLH